MTIRTLPIALLVLGAGVLAATAAPAQQPSYTIDDVTACSGDAMRLCRDKLPDLDNIETCMKANYEKLHPACRARFDREH